MKKYNLILVISILLFLSGCTSKKEQKCDHYRYSEHRDNKVLMNGKTESGYDLDEESTKMFINSRYAQVLGQVVSCRDYMPKEDFDKLLERRDKMKKAIEPYK